MNKYSTASLSLLLIALVSPMLFINPLLMGGLIFSVIAVKKSKNRRLGSVLFILNLAAFLIINISNYRRENVYKKRMECLNRIDRTPESIEVLQKLKETSNEIAERKCYEIK